MGYQEVFIKSKNNGSTRILLKAMIRENIRSDNDMFTSINCVAVTKSDLLTIDGEMIKKGTELIVVTGERLYSTKSYLSTEDGKMPYSVREMLIATTTKSIPIENTLIKDIKDYESKIKDINVKEFLKHIEKEKESR